MIKTPPLRLERLQHEGLYPATDFNQDPDPSCFYMATANQDLWVPNGPSKAGITLERVLTNSGISIDYGARREVPTSSDVWLTRFMRPEHEGWLLEIDEINDLLASNTEPDTRITQPAEYPSLLLAYRAVPVGTLALRALNNLPEINRAAPVAASGIYSIYPENTVVASVVDPAFDMTQAAAAVQDLLTA